MARMRRKADLPTKICVACGKPFAWRKKWARDWEAVRYCSDRCRSAGPKAGEGVGRVDVEERPRVVDR
jgi:hypothetical protein